MVTFLWDYTTNQFLLLLSTSATQQLWSYLGMWNSILKSTVECCFAPFYSLQFQLILMCFREIKSWKQISTDMSLFSLSCVDIQFHAKVEDNPSICLVQLQRNLVWTNEHSCLLSWSVFHTMSSPTEQTAFRNRNVIVHITVFWVPYHDVTPVIS